MTRDKLKALIVRRYSPRLHMSMILMACGLTGMAASWALLHAGVHSMLVRYPVSLVLAYATFLIGVWVWLRATGLGPASHSSPGSRFADGIDLPSGGGRGGGSWGGGSSSGSSGGGFSGRGGSFDGGGASASFAEARAPMVGVPLTDDSGASSVVARSGGKSWGDGLSLDLDGDGLVLVILAALLALAVFLLSGYLIWSAPDVLTEAAFGASLAGVLARPAKKQAQSGWVMGVVRKTWWPFAIILALALGFAGWSAAHYPQAATFKQALEAATHS